MHAAGYVLLLANRQACFSHALSCAKVPGSELLKQTCGRIADGCCAYLA